jgi:hypothetical protein
MVSPYGFLATLHNSAMLGPSHPETYARCTAMTKRPCKTRDSTRPALQTAVRNRRRSCLEHAPSPPPGGARLHGRAARTGAAKYPGGAHEHKILAYILLLILLTVSVSTLLCRFRPLVVPPPLDSYTVLPRFVPPFATEAV